MNGRPNWMRAPKLPGPNRMRPCGRDEMHGALK
jgi:hypothetical protein